MFAARHLRWVDVDPSTHPFDADAVGRWLEDAADAASLRATRDRHSEVTRISHLLVRSLGLWSVGWAWSPDDGGPVLAQFDEPPPRALDRVLRALVDWRCYIEELARVFAAVPRADTLEHAIELAAARVLPIVLERTEASDAWYTTLGSALSWYVDYAGLAGETDDLHTAIARATRYEFTSWVAPEDDAAELAIKKLAAHVTRRPPTRDALETWLDARDSAFRYFEQTAHPPVTADGHARFIDEVDRARDRERAERMHGALLLCRDSARRGMRLSFDQLAEWQAVVLGASTPAALRTTDAFAKAGRERYGMRPDLAALVDRALDEAHAGELAFVARAARLYLDICFLHPFADGNARAARLALDHLLTANGYAIQDAAPLFVLARSADDVPGAWAFAAAIDLLVGPLTTG